jgi:hypothetical protein
MEDHKLAMNKLQIYFLVIFNLTSVLCVYEEKAKQRKMPEKLKNFH